MQRDPAKVAEAGFKALMSGDDKDVAGLANKAHDVQMKGMTEPQKAKAHTLLSKPGSGE